MREIRRWCLLACGLGIILYAVTVVLYAQASPEIGLRCAFDTRLVEVDPDYQPDLEQSDLAQPNDRLVQLGLKPLRSWSDYVLELAKVWSWPELGDIPDEQLLAAPRQYAGYLVKRGDERLVWVEYERDGMRHGAWRSVGPPPAKELVYSLLWFLFKIGFFVVVAIVYWQRPEDTAVRRLFVLCIVTVGAFMGGYHWLWIASSPPLVLVLLICTVLLPVVCLHFYISFPRPKAFYRRHPRWTLAILFGVPGLVLVAMLPTYLTLVWVRRFTEPEPDPATVNAILGVFQYIIAVSIAVSGCLFLGCIISLIHSYLTSQPGSRERNQVKWILTGALAAAIPIGYALFLAVTDPDHFRLGGAAWTMFAASMCFTVAYMISISRYGLMEVGKVLNWGIASIAVSVTAGFVYVGMVFLGTFLIGSQLESQSSFRQAIWVSLTAWLLLLGLDLFRWRMRKAIDRLLHREKYQLDRTLEQMSQAVEQLVDPPTLCRRLLNSLSELLSFNQGAAYVRQGEPPLYVLTSHLKDRPQLNELPPGSPLVDALAQSPLVRVPPQGSNGAPAQQQLALLGGEIALALRHEGAVMAIILVGPRSTGRYDIEELHLLTTFAQLAAIALHGAQGRQQIETLNRDLQGKVEKISEQQRRIVVLQSQLLREHSSAQESSPPVSPEPVAPPAPALAFSRPIVGSSLMTQQLLATIRKVAASPSAVLIRGESGTGKELLARALHENSARSAKMFVKVHCAALSAGLLESELFGHVKGAFTGAHKDKIGRFELANGGTLFLDEIGDISLEVQTKLLRVLQEMTFERVGSSQPVKVDVRIIAATHQDLERLMREGKFREDLYYRLNVITISTPPLRDRREDIAELATHFLDIYCRRSGKEIATIDDDALVALKSYRWPGNIRELENVIERAVVLADGATITMEELPPELCEADTVSKTTLSRQTAMASVLVPEASWSAQQEQAERERLVRALAAAGGNKSQAARALGMPRSTLMSKLEKHGLAPRRV